MVGRFSHRDCFPTVSWAGIQFKPTSTFTEPEGLLVKEPQEAGWDMEPLLQTPPPSSDLVLIQPPSALCLHVQP